MSMNLSNIAILKIKNTYHCCVIIGLSNSKYRKRKTIKLNIKSNFEALNLFHDLIYLLYLNNKYRY